MIFTCTMVVPEPNCILKEYANLKMLILVITMNAEKNVLYNNCVYSVSIKQIIDSSHCILKRIFICVRSVFNWSSITFLQKIWLYRQCLCKNYITCNNGILKEYTIKSKHHLQYSKWSSITFLQRNMVKTFLVLKLVINCKTILYS